ncbi:MAG: polysaccharide deacetylase family protein, partial [Methanophagales archaeon]|nr:polysaccharide deacetylase family protein [Methanophagales archaeon]
MGASLLKRDNESGRGCIDILLNLFEKHKISATWAVVGHLFLDHCEEEDGIPHKDMPRSREDWYSTDPCTDIKRDPLYYGKDIVEKILSNRIEHEIGYHTFSHVPFSECSREVAEAEIKMSDKLAKEFGITPKSFVFPYNTIGHVDVLKEYCFKIYRGENGCRRYDPSQNILVRKFNRGINKLIAPPVDPKWMDGIWVIPSSMLFCDPQIKFSVLPRAKVGLYRAIRSKKVFHIWLHPHNLLMYPSLKDDLDRFLGIVSKKRDEGKIKVMTMGEFSEVLDEENEK